MNQGLHYMRNPRRVVLTGRDRVVFPGHADEAIAHATRQPGLWSELLRRLSRPQTRHDLFDVCPPPNDLDEALLQRLAAAKHLLAEEDETRLSDERRAVLTSSPAFSLERRPRACSRVLVGCTGSIVAGLIAPTLLSLAYSGFQQELDVILTESASRFLTRDLLEAYGLRTWADAFERTDGIRVPHVTLAQRADAILVLPATADVLNRVAHSACSDLLSLCITASDAPVVLCPAMNEIMWCNAGVQRNLETLRRDGHYILEPTLIFGAADFAADAEPMYGGHGTLWSGPLALMQALEAVLESK